MSVISIKPNTFVFTVMLAGLSAMPPLCIDMNLPAIPLIESAYGVASGQGALTLSLFLLGFSLAPILGGPLSDRFGRKITLITSLSFTSATAFACAAAPSFSLLLFFRLVQGATAGTCVLVPLAIVRDTLKGADARKQVSKMMVVMGLAPLLAPIIGSGMLSLAGWRSIYGVQGGIGVFLLLLILLGFEESLSQEKRRPFNISHMAGGYKTVLSSRVFLSLALTVACGFGCMFSYIAGSPALLLGKLQLSDFLYSLAFALTSLGLVAGSLLSTWLGRRDLPVRPIIITGLCCMSLMVCATLALGLTGNIQTANILPLLFLVMLCFGTIQPNAMAKAVEPLAEMAGTASGALNSIQMLVGSGASALVTFLAGFLEPGLAMTSAMAFWVLLSLLIFCLLSSGISGKNCRNC